MKRYDRYIGIDPDKDKSGITVLELDGGEKRKMTISVLGFPFLIDRLQQEKERAESEERSLLLIVEASWLIQTNWHTLRRDTVALAAAKGHSVGENHMVGRLIVEMARHIGMNVYEQVPLKKCWRGKDGKITNDEFNVYLRCNGLEPVKRSNQEERDSALIALVSAGLNRYRRM